MIKNSKLNLFFIRGWFLKLVLNCLIDNWLDSVGLEACSQGKAAIDCDFVAERDFDVGTGRVPRGT